MREVELIDTGSLSPSVRSLRFRCCDGAPLTFVPGQWVNLFVDVAGEPIRRAYSIAGADEDRAPDTFELAVTQVEGGGVSSLLHRATPGYRCRMDGPHGFFTRAGLLDEPALLVGTGSGLSPLRAMLHEAVARPSPVALTVLFGCRRQADVLWRDELEMLAATHPAVSVHVTLSRPDSGWQGRTGYVQDHLSELVDRAVKPHAFICGLSPMIKAVRRTLKESLGYDRRRIHSERFD